MTSDLAVMCLALETATDRELSDRRNGTMAGIGNVNASVIAGSEASRNEQTRGKRAPGKRSGTSTDRASGSVIEDLPVAQLLELAKEIAQGDKAVRPELVQSIQNRLDEGQYENREVIEKLAQSLLYLFDSREPR